MTDELFKQFDYYNRTARLYPVLIAIAPAVWTFIALAHNDVGLVWTGVVAATITCAGMYFLVSISRHLGKLLEPRLLKNWGGWPTTVLLRHADSTVDTATKARYHDALGKLTGLQMPTAAQEAADPRNADDVYRSATKKLIEARRDEKRYPMVLHENASYGFRRNLYGLKAVGISIAIACAIASFAVWTFRLSELPSFVTTGNQVRAAPDLLLLAAADLAYAALWLTATARFCHQAGKEYAEALFRTLD